MAALRFTRKEAQAISRAIAAWESESVIDAALADKLKSTYEVSGFDWKRLAKYSLWTSVICIVIAIGAVIADRFLVKYLIRLFGTVDRAYCVVFGLSAVILYYVGIHRRSRKPEKAITNEAIMLLGVIATATSIAFLAADLKVEHGSLFFLLAALIYGGLGLWFPSILVWIFALLSLGSWFEVETGYLSGWGAYYVGMNYPLRFSLFGAALTAGSMLFAYVKPRRAFMRPTTTVGLLYLFVALWILSIFGNYGDIGTWYQVKQFELFGWSILFGAVAIASIYIGLRYDDAVTRGFGLVFLFLNLYTRFFEYFWDHLHKALFFGLLAVSFWYVGSRAEKIWRLGGRFAGQRPDENTTRVDS